MTKPETLPGLLGRATERAGEEMFLHCPSASGPVDVSFAEFEDRTLRVATGLREKGIGRGDRVAIAAPNQVEWLELFFGAARIGAITVTLNVRYREHELDYMLNHSGARLLVTASADGERDLVAFYAGFRDRIPAVEHILFLGSGPRSYEELVPLEAAADLPRPEDVVQPDMPAMILYTSGTTGTPKGATLTHGSMLGAARAQVEHLGTTADDVYVGVMPLNHVGGITCTIVAALLTRSTVGLQAGFSPVGTLEAIASRRATVFAGVPTMWRLMLDQDTFEQHDTSCLRTAVVGGANADPDLCAAITRGFPSARLRNLYGLSEVSGACVISAADDELATVSRTLGVPLPGVETQVVDLDGRAVAPGADGELFVRGPGTAAGYWNAPDETAHTFSPNGWVATGDMVTAERDGHIELRGRRKEMFVQGGYNVYPVEVENVLAAHPAVAMAAGIGVADPVLGEIGHFYIVTHPDTAITEDELLAHCRTQLADYKIPRRITFADELPLTPAGKIAKATLREKHERSL